MEILVVILTNEMKMISETNFAYLPTNKENIKS